MISNSRPGAKYFGARDATIIPNLEGTQGGAITRGTPMFVQPMKSMVESRSTHISIKDSATDPSIRRFRSGAAFSSAPRKPFYMFLLRQPTILVHEVGPEGEKTVVDSMNENHIIAS
jgi:hypothetical protein